MLAFGFYINKLSLSGDLLWSKNFESTILEFCLLANRCPPVPELPFSVPDSSLTEDGSVIQYSCVEGYFLPGNTTESLVTCQDGIWNYSKSFACEGKMLKFLQNTECTCWNIEYCAMPAKWGLHILYNIRT